VQTLRIVGCEAVCCFTRRAFPKNRFFAEPTLKVDLRYMPLEDRMVLSVRGHSAWLLTRNLLLKLIQAWLDSLEKVALPKVPVPMGQRSLAQEHKLSLEEDKPVINQEQVAHATPVLINKVDVRVSEAGVSLTLHGGEKAVNLNFTRKDAHLVLEMLAGRARAAKWTDGVVWPPWLGSE